jgi:DNA ligase D-like protein (predicted ligase)
MKAGFVEPMLLLATDNLPDDLGRWSYELKLDGYRAIAFKQDRKVYLQSRNNKDLSKRFPSVVRGLAGLPEDTVIDGEIVALDAEQRPSFGLLQVGQTEGVTIVFFVFDVLIVRGQSVMSEVLSTRRSVLEEQILPYVAKPVRYVPPFELPVRDLIASAKAEGLEGLVAKRRDSRYEPGRRSGQWLKMRTSQARNFVIGGYTLGTVGFDALVFGYFDESRLVYVGRTTSGFTGGSRRVISQHFVGLEMVACPFANLPQKRAGRFGEGLTREKMASCRWLRPELVGRFSFVEWTDDGHLRHPRFIGLREDVRAVDVGRDKSTGRRGSEEG